MRMKNKDMYLNLKKFLIFWPRVCQNERHRVSLVDLQAIVGNMDEEHREWFCQRYEPLPPAGE